MTFIIPAGTPLAMGDLADGTFLQKSGSSIVGSSQTGETYVRLTANRSTSSSSFQDCTGLSFSAAASTTYLFRFTIMFQNLSATTGINLAVNGPASPTRILTQTWIAINAGSVKRMARAYDSGTISTNVTASSSNHTALVTGILENGGNTGTFILRFASNGTNTIQINLGSILAYRVL